MAFQKGLGRLGRKRCHKTVVGMGQVQGQIVRLLLHAGNYNQRLAKIHLRLARCMRQRHEHLPAANLFATHVVLHDRVVARESMLFF